MLRKQKCITCNGQVKTCGLCASCYSAADRMVKRGQVTRETLEEKGLILPPSQTGPGNSGPFAEAVKRKRISLAPSTR